MFVAVVVGVAFQGILKIQNQKQTLRPVSHIYCVNKRFVSILRFDVQFKFHNVVLIYSIK